MAKRSFRSNRMGALVLSLGLALGVSACSPAHTLDLFDPSDGVRVTLEGEVKATNLLILTESAGSPGTLVGSLTNITDDAISVEVAIEGAAPIIVDIKPGYTVYLTPRTPDFQGTSEAFDAQVTNVATPPGGTADVTVTTASGGSTSVLVPVLDGTLEPYDEYLP